MATEKYTLRRPTCATWRDLGDVSHRLVRFLDNARYPSSTRRGVWAPAVNATESSDELLLSVELPGLREDDISIELEDRVLFISGDKTEDHLGEEDRRYHLVERTFGSFRRSFTLPSTVDGSNIAAIFEGGVLTVKLPKSAEVKGRTIEITK